MKKRLRKKLHKSEYQELGISMFVTVNENNAKEKLDSIIGVAENLSYWMSKMIPHIEHSPTDFLHDKDEVTDTVLNNYDKFKKWIKIADSVGITEKTLTAFCKNVDNAQSVIHLKALGHLMYPEWLMAMYLYLENSISKVELQNVFVEYSVFAWKVTPANFSKFRKIILEIEDCILQITNKQIYRNIKKSESFDIFVIQ